jgi:PAS domain S-box-containing protein
MGLRPYIDRALAGEVVMVPPFYLDPAKLKGGKPGRARWLEAWFSPIRNSDGSTRELAVILKDVTDQFETQKVLEDLQSKYRIASESLSLAVKVGKVGIWEWFPKEDKVVWDETTEMMYGYKKGEFPETSAAYLSHLHPDDRERCWILISDAIQNGRGYNMDNRVVRKDGEVRWIQGSGMPFYNEQNEVIRVIGTAIDITYRKEQAEDQKFISDISEILSSSFDFAVNIQRVIDLTVENYFDGVIVDRLVDDKTTQPIASSGIHSGSVYEQILSGKTGPIAIVRLFLEDSGTRKISERLKNIAGEIGYRISLAVENSLLFLHSQEAIRARDEFLSIASHELKTPLQSLTLQNEMRKRMLERSPLNSSNAESLVKALDMDRRQLTRINRLIDDMLDISRIRNSRLSIQKEKFDLLHLIDDLSERLLPQLEASGCTLRKDYSGTLEVYADSYRLEQVIANILINAMKYGAGSPVFIRAKLAQKKVLIEIEDEGPGIREEDCERIFHRFERAVSSNEVSGMGLGLYISRQIMELHDGTLHATSELGKGSTFIMELPL